MIFLNDIIAMYSTVRKSTEQKTKTMLMKIVCLLRNALGGGGRSGLCDRTSHCKRHL
jgi:hypothetical protein